MHLRTADLERSLGFYSGTLGFKTVERGGASASLAAAEGAPALVVLTEDRAAQRRPARATGLYHFAIRYPSRRDLAQALVRLARKDYPIGGAADHIVSEAIYLNDPDRLGVELYADRPRAQWNWSEGQVEMATDPLDLDSLLETAGGEAELAAPPAQTDIGHIHLHVADLSAAERYYHGFLGLDVTQRSYPGALFFSAGGYHHHVAANIWAGSASAPQHSVGLLAYRLEVPGGEALAQVRGRAVEAGCEIDADPKASPDLLRIRDPNGAWLEVNAASRG